MEVPEMEGGKQPETPRSSAAAFVEGGIQNACDDACSICLEQFCESDPSTVTNCKHEYHLQCILEWCQRSSQCPMCWQAISLKDPNSQELLAAVEQERNIRLNPPRNAAVFIHPILGEFELPHLPIGVNDAELEERIIQHLTAAAAMGRAHHFSRRDGHRSRSSGRPHLIFSPQSGGPTSGHMSSPLTGAETEPAVISVASPSTPSNSLSSGGHEASQQVLQFSPVQADRNSSTSRSTVIPTNRHGFSFDDRSTSIPSSLTNQDRAGPSDLQSFSESLKSRFNAASMRYKESISKSTRGWKERLFSRNSSMSSLGSEIRAEVNAGIASVSRMVEQLDTRDNSRASQASVSNQNNQNTSESHG